MKRKLIVVLSFLFVVQMGFSQEKEELKHRVAVVLGHSYISLGNNETLAIPSFGLDYEYWISNKWGVGVFSDIELINKEVVAEVHGSSIERECPVVLTLDAIWKPFDHFEFVVGPGVVFENGELENLIRFGFEYDLELGHHWDVAPSFFYDQKIEGGATYSIGIGIGKRF